MADETETESEETTEETETKEEPKGLSQDDINRLIEAARKQEKDKLYETISSLKDQVTDLSEGRKNEKAEREKVEETARAEAERERLAKLSAEERFTEQLSKFEEQLAERKAAEQRLRAELDQERTLAELERYKNEVLSSAGDEILRELVTGKTKSEIDASVNSAKAKYQDYFASAVQNAKGDPGRKVKTDMTGRMPSPADPDPDPMDEEDLKGLRGLTRPDMNTGQMNSREQILARNRGVSKEYEKNKEDLLNKVGDLYQKMNSR